MKTLYLAVILSYITGSAQAHRFYYNLEFKKDSTQAESSTALMILDINPNDIKFYDHVFLEKEQENAIPTGQNRCP